MQLLSITNCNFKNLVKVTSFREYFTKLNETIRYEGNDLQDKGNIKARQKVY